jgi:hypothetical protein
MVAAAHPQPTPRTDRLFRHCMYCGAEQADNALAGRVPPGRRLAYDPSRARLWSVCHRCTRWNLVPLDERPDALDHLERVVRRGAGLLGATDNVSLHDYWGLSIVRIGRAPFAETAWWRYGREMRRREAEYRRSRTRLTALGFGALAYVGNAAGVVDAAIDWSPDAVQDLVRWHRFGLEAWHGRARCSHCNSVLRRLFFDDAWWLHPRIEKGRLVVGVPCTRCDPWTPRNVFELRGDDAALVLRRVLACQNVTGAPEPLLRQATGLLHHAGDAPGLVHHLADGRTSLHRLGPARRLALEMAMTAIAERDGIAATLRGFEATWRREEEIARIVDEEL